MRTAIVTGASGNLGQAVVQKFLSEGYAVEGTGSLLMDAPHFHSVTVDLVNEEAAAEWVQAVINKHKTIDVAVLTVGGFAMADIAGTSTAMIGQQYRLNFETAYNVARPVFVQMIKQGTGTIFLIGSKAGMEAANSKGMIAYGLSKSLLFRLAELMNEEAAGTAVNTMVIVPSTIDTPQNRAAMPAADFSKWQTPEAIADVIFSNTKHKDSNSPVIEL
ncbi:MAG TPA: SDR family NAD(P)-dependent oxidoreductase [Chitinophagaceae bacterium]|nr:SDR family NAD(P)-dependent oxidoreductase [Chitinophagaceae bacterium]